MIRRLVTIAACTLLVGTVGVMAGTTEPVQQEDAVRDLVARYVDARERRDSSAIRSLFTSDADQLTTSGEWRRGIEQIVAGTAASSERNPGTRAIHIETVRFLSPDIAVADGRYEIRGTSGAPRPMWTTFVVTRTANGWRIAAIRNMRPTGQ